MRLRLTNKADWKRLVDYVKHLPWKRDDGAGIAYLVTVEEMKPKRTIEQNARYFAMITDISRIAPSYMGGEWHSPESWHEYCKRRFLGMEAGPFGEGVVRSTAKLKVGEFADFMTEVEAWGISQFPGWTFDYDREAA
jgi:hypothetical protein